MPSFDLQQYQKLSQIQILSQRQIQALELLSLGSQDLRSEVYKEVEENPALIITKDSLEAGAELRVRPRNCFDNTRIGSAGAAGMQASDNFQAALESKADMRESLQEHLLSQFNMLPLRPEEKIVGEKLIGNLNQRGFHILAPVSLLDKSDPRQNQAVLDKCLALIRQLDPAGTCTANTEESLYVQAQQIPDAPLLALFLLDGHFDFLNPPQGAKIAKKVQAYLEKQKKLFGAPEPERYEGMEVSEESAERAVNFIRTLDPYPARDYSSTETTYIAPDVYVEKFAYTEDDNIIEDFSKGIVLTPHGAWQLKLARDSLPQLEINPSYQKYQEGSEMLNKGIKKAKDFMDLLAYRQKLVLTASCIIVKRQHEFFAKGSGHLVPLKQQDIADVLGVHETTISRMANSKYLQCGWGLFEIKYFFTNAVSNASSSVSKDMAQHEIEKILQEHKDDKKKLSDQKISDILQERGISIARRTVAKYRSLMGL